MAEEKLKRSRNLLPCPSQWVYNSSTQERKQKCFQLWHPLRKASDYILCCLKETKRANSVSNRPVLMQSWMEFLTHNLCRAWRNALLAGKKHNFHFPYGSCSTYSQSRSDNRLGLGTAVVGQQQWWHWLWWLHFLTGLTAPRLTLKRSANRQEFAWLLCSQSMKSLHLFFIVFFNLSLVQRLMLDDLNLCG